MKKEDPDEIAMHVELWDSMFISVADVSAKIQTFASLM